MNKERTKMNIDFFISHSGEMKTSIAIPLAQCLSAMGFDVWIDKKGIFSGEYIYPTIKEAIAYSSYCIAIIDKNFLKKEWTKEELRLFHCKELETDTTVILPVYITVEKSIVCETFSWLDGRAFENMQNTIFSERIDWGIVCRIVSCYYKNYISKSIEEFYYILEEYSFPCKDTLISLLKTKTYPTTDFRIAVIEMCNIGGIAHAIYSAIMPSSNKIIDTSFKFSNILRDFCFDANYQFTYDMYIAATLSVTATLEQLAIFLDFS